MTEIALITTARYMPCPFCGEDDAQYDRLEIDGELRHRVRCYTCGAVGPYSDTQAWAIASWNCRNGVDRIRRGGKWVKAQEQQP